MLPWPAISSAPDLYLGKHVAAQFTSGAPGLWLGFWDFGRLFQDAAGTIPVTATGQPVGLVLDKSGRGNHARQTLPNSRPTLQQDSTGRYYLLFDGLDDFLVTGAINFTATDKVTIWAGVRKLNDVFSTICELSSSSTTNNGTFYLSNGVSRYNFLSKGSIAANAIKVGFTSPATSVLACQGDITSDVTRLTVNDARPVTTATDQGAGNYGNYPVYIGRRGGSSSPANIRLYELIVLGAAADAAAISIVNSYVNAKIGAY